MEFLTTWFADFGLGTAQAAIAATGLAGLGVILLAWFAHFIARRITTAFITRVLERTENKRDDILLRRKVFERAANFAPALVIYSLAPIVFEGAPSIGGFVVNASLIYMVAVGVIFFDALINAGLEIYRTFPISRSFPITSFTQVAKLILYFFGFVAALSIVLGESPATFLAGFGALAAVLMFVFKDPILGFVSGLQLSANRMVAVGDWIEMPKFGVDGDVMEIGLTTVKIRNFDKTITTVPTQSLVNDSFKNWRGMTETGGRRIKRAVHIDVSTIRFCDEAMLKQFSKIQYIADYIAEKQKELAEHNAQLGADLSTLANGRHLTNVGTFRAYVIAYLKNHPKISDVLTFLVRQLPPTEQGLPIEIYVFSTDTNWIRYEGIQADIFDHILAVAPVFGLRVFQNPTGADFAAFGETQDRIT